MAAILFDATENSVGFRRVADWIIISSDVFGYFLFFMSFFLLFFYITSSDLVIYTAFAWLILSKFNDSTVSKLAIEATRSRVSSLSLL